jgi:hypothetical protein
MATTTKPTTKPQAPTEDVNAQIERELQAQIERELAAEMARKREEIAARLRREAFSKEMDRINRRHPIQDALAGLTPAQHQARLDAMAAGAKADAEWMDRVNARPIEGAARRCAGLGGRWAGARAFVSRGPDHDCLRLRLVSRSRRES